MSEPIAYMRDLDGTGSLHACAKGDKGAIPVYADPVLATQAAQIEALKKALKTSRQYVFAVSEGMGSKPVVSAAKRDLATIDAALSNTGKK